MFAQWLIVSCRVTSKKLYLSLQRRPMDFLPRDVNVPRMVETSSWPTAVSCGTFAQWLILYCRVTSKEVGFIFATMSYGMFDQWLILFCRVPPNVVVFLFELTQSVATSFHKMKATAPSTKTINPVTMQSAWYFFTEKFWECEIWTVKIN